MFSVCCLPVYSYNQDLPLRLHVIIKTHNHFPHVLVYIDVHWHILNVTNSLQITFFGEPFSMEGLESSAA